MADGPPWAANKLAVVTGGNRGLRPRLCFRKKAVSASAETSASKPSRYSGSRSEGKHSSRPGNRRAPSRPWRASRCTSPATVRFGEPLRSRSSGSPRAAQRVFGTRIRAHRRADLMASGTGSHADVKRRSFRDRAQIENPRAVPHLGGRGFILQRFVILRARQGRDKSWTSEYTAGAKRPTTPLHQVDLRLSCTLHYLFCYSGKYDLRLDLSQASRHRDMGDRRLCDREARAILRHCRGRALCPPTRLGLDRWRSFATNDSACPP